MTQNPLLLGSTHKPKWKSDSLLGCESFSRVELQIPSTSNPHGSGMPGLELRCAHCDASFWPS